VPGDEDRSSSVLLEVATFLGDIERLVLLLVLHELLSISQPPLHILPLLGVESQAFFFGVDCGLLHPQGAIDLGGSSEYASLLIEQLYGERGHGSLRILDPLEALAEGDSRARVIHAHVHARVTLGLDEPL